MFRIQIYKKRSIEIFNTSISIENIRNSKKKRQTKNEKPAKIRNRPKGIKELQRNKWPSINTL